MTEKKKLSAAEKSRNETISGMVAGFVCKLVEYPLDTVKVQGPNALSPLQMLTKTVKKDGFLGLYRGIPSPLLGSMMENSILFASYGLASRLLHKGEVESLPYSTKLFCGGFSGACVATILTPVELIKCKMQTTNEAAVRYKSTFECLLATVKEGGPTAIFKGHVGTLCREIPGNMAWFGGYELALSMQIPLGGTRSEVSPVGLMCSGALGGAMYWLLPFPFDVVKSKIQTGTHGLPLGARVNVITVLKHVSATEGFKGLYRGCAITVGRAAPSNAVLFCVYEMCMRFLAGDPVFGN